MSATDRGLLLRSALPCQKYSPADTEMLLHVLPLHTITVLRGTVPSVLDALMPQIACVGQQIRSLSLRMHYSFYRPCSQCECMTVTCLLAEPALHGVTALPHSMPCMHTLTHAVVLQSSYHRILW